MQDALRAATGLLANDPYSTEGQLVQGLAALEYGTTKKALLILERAAMQAPADSRLQIALGRTFVALGRQTPAYAAFQRALTLSPDSAESRLHLALLALSGRHEDKALQLLQEAVAITPGLADAQFHIGNLLCERRQLLAAEQHYRQALKAQPTHAEAHANLGGLLKELGRSDEAAGHLEQALKIKPELAPASFNLAMLRIDQLRWDEAVDLLRRTLKSDPQQPDAQYWLGNALMGQGDAVAARRAYQAVLGLDSSFDRARWGFVMAQLPAVPQTQTEQFNSAQNFSREVKKLRNWVAANNPQKAYQAVGAQQPYYLAYVAQNHREVLSEYGAICTKLMLGWAGKMGMPAPVARSGAKCRVGIVSGHICRHSVWHAIVRGWVEHLDPAKFELHLFYTGEQRDAETEWAARHAKRLHHRLGDWTSWAKAIADGRFDVLIYPEVGMDATSLRLSALRLAKVQLASWGHPLSTGLPTIDGFITAAAFEPEGATQHYTEPLFALPRLGCCYKAFGTQAAPVDIGKWGIKPHEKVLICAGTPFKYAPGDDAILLDIARRCAPCKMIFFRAKPEPLGQLRETRLRKVFAAGGIDYDECVCMIPWQSQADFFGLLDRADVYLDTIGFSGFNTTMQAIERATPIVAWEGEFMRGRFASGILREAGLSEWVANSSDGYIERVQRLCSDSALGDHVRSQIVKQRTPLFDDREPVIALGELLRRLS